MEGPHAGRTGEIKHIFRHTLFLHSKLYPENGGLFVCLCRLVAATGFGQQSTPTPTSMAPSLVPMSPRYSAMPPPPPAITATPQAGLLNMSWSPGGGRGGATPGQRVPAYASSRRDTSMNGQTVRITQGPFKGWVREILSVVKPSSSNWLFISVKTSFMFFSEMK